LARECRVLNLLGLYDYNRAYRLQKKLLADRKNKKISDMLILLNHHPVLTIGRKGQISHILAGPEVIAREGIQVCVTDRGGGITYHGPGQLVGYPILDLKQHGRDIRLLIGRYEETVIRLLQLYGLQGERIPEYPGVWVKNEKVCAIGIGVSNWVTYHGFALNITPDISHFSYIIPCGIAGMGVTSMSRLLGGEIDEKKVREQLVDIFGRIFNLKMEYCSREEFDSLF